MQTLTKALPVGPSTYRPTSPKVVTSFFGRVFKTPILGIPVAEEDIGCARFLLDFLDGDDRRLDIGLFNVFVGGV